MLFGIYDADGSGALSYKEFSDGVFGRPQTAQSNGARPATAQGGSGNAVRHPEELAEALKNKLATRGARGIIGLQR